MKKREAKEMINREISSLEVTKNDNNKKIALYGIGGTLAAVLGGYVGVALTNFIPQIGIATFMLAPILPVAAGKAIATNVSHNKALSKQINHLNKIKNRGLISNKSMRISNLQKANNIEKEMDSMNWDLSDFAAIAGGLTLFVSSGLYLVFAPALALATGALGLASLVGCEVYSAKQVDKYMDLFATDENLKNSNLYSPLFGTLPQDSSNKKVLNNSKGDSAKTKTKDYSEEQIRKAERIIDEMSAQKSDVSSPKTYSKSRSK